MWLTKHNGVFIPSRNSDTELSGKIKEGDEVYASRKRNPKFHRLVLSLFQLGFDNQDEYRDFEVYRKELTKEAGFTIEENGKVHARSIAYENMSEEDFNKLYNAILELISVKLQTDKQTLETERINYE
jgi:hypothetical protein